MLLASDRDDGERWNGVGVGVSVGLGVGVAVDFGFDMGVNVGMGAAPMGAAPIADAKVGFGMLEGFPPPCPPPHAQHITEALNSEVSYGAVSLHQCRLAV